ALQPELIERAKQLGRIAIDTKCSGTQKLGFTVTPAQQPDAQEARAARCQQIPDSIADDVALTWRKAESLQAGEEEVRLGFGARHVPALDDHHVFAHTEHLERAINLGPPPGRCDAIRDLALPQVP